MATAGDERRESEVAGAGGPGPQTTTNASGIILDKDGKPCRSCNSKVAFSNFMKGVPKAPASGPASATSTTTAATTTTTTSPTKPECPPDVEALGRSTWTLLHSIAAQYPDRPSTAQQSDLLGFMKLFSRLYPCWVCAEDFQGYIARNEPPTESRGKFGLWLCGAHNEVNRKLGKREFDCARWEERWRTGPKDGSCD